MASYAIYPSLKDRAVFVTGGGCGIGASIVEHFCAQGSKVAFVDIAREASETLVKAIAGEGAAGAAVHRMRHHGHRGAAEGDRRGQGEAGADPRAGEQRGARPAPCHR